MTDFEVATYVLRPPEALPDVLRQYQVVLEELGFTDPHLTSWLSDVAWEPDGSGFGHLGTPSRLNHVTAGGREWIAQPFVLGYTDSAIQQPNLAWLQLSLQFEDRPAPGPLLIDEVSGKYLPGVGAAMWQVEVAFATEFRDAGVYFNDAATVNAPWYSLTGRDDDRWAFDLAIVPHSLEEYFHPIPPGYARGIFADGIGFARTLSWATIPWLEIG